MDRGSFARCVETQELDYPVMLVIDLIMFKGVDEVSSNLVAWRGEHPEPKHLKCLREYLARYEEKPDVPSKASEFI